MKRPAAKIVIAKNTGFCKGVKRAVQIAERTLAENPGRNVYSLGPVIHNSEAMRKLSGLGLKVAKSVAGIPEGSVLILPSHGTPESVITVAAGKRLKLVDVTCPHVASVKRICRDLCARGRKVVIIGEAEHAEIKALKDSAPGCIIIENEEQVPEGLFTSGKIGIISQTTQSKDRFLGIVGVILKKNPLVKEVDICNTVCRDSAGRQEEAKKLAAQVELMLVIGSATSANTRRLAEIGASVNGNTHLVEKPAGNLADKVKGTRSIGVISGASTPSWLIEEVIGCIKENA